MNYFLFAGLTLWALFPFFGFEYILVVINYVSKWIETIPTKTNNANFVVKYLKDVIFRKFGALKVIVSDG